MQSSAWSLKVLRFFGKKKQIIHFLQEILKKYEKINQTITIFKEKSYILVNLKVKVYTFNDKGSNFVQFKILFMLKTAFLNYTNLVFRQKIYFP